jgi:signal transduction histidine kinase
MLDGMRDSARFTKRYVHRDGSIIWTDLSTTLHRDTAGDPLYFITTVVDITDTVTAQQELLAHRERLEELVAERTRELEEANAAKNDFLASMSHELRTPLNSILGFSQVMLDGMAGELTPEQTRQLEMIHASGQHLLSLINDVLDLAKIEAHHVEVTPEDFEFCDSVRQVMDTLRPLAQRKGLDLTLDCVTTTVAMHTDGRLLRQILLNILGNAIKFTEDGAVTLRLARDGDDVWVSVTDTGPGIAPENIDEIFTEFGRGQRARQSGAEGTGLGLAISRRLAELLGGTLVVVSTPGEGSTFTVRVPVCWR